MKTITRPLKAEEWLSEIGRRIDRLAARAGIGELADELTTWRGRLDQLHVQAALGAMEARDRVVPLLDRIEAAVREVEGLFEDFGDGEVLDEEGLSKEVRAAMATLGKEIDAAEELH